MLATQKIRVAANTGFNVPGTDWSIGEFGEVESVNDPAEGTSSWGVPIEIPDGATYASARFRVKPAGTDGQLTCSIVRYVDGATSSVIGSAVSSTGSAWEDVTVTATIENIANSTLLAVVNNHVGETGTGVRRFSLVELTPA